MALAFVDSPVLVPQNPVAGQTVSVSIRVGTCDVFVAKPGYPQITRNGSAIRILFASAHATSIDWCIFPTGTLITPIGKFPSGNYTLQVDRTYQDFLGNDVVETLGTLGYTVAAAQPVKIPTLDVYGFALLLFGVLIMAAFALHRHRPAALHFLPLLMIAFGCHAQTATDRQVAALLLNSGHGAPSAQAVVNYYASKTRNDAPPLASLAVGDPKIVAYLLPLRAHGDFAAFLAAHPNSTRAKLERYLVVVHSPGTDTKAAVKSMVADPNVAVTYTIPTSTFSSVQLLQFRVEDHDVPTQYGRSALDINAAWQLEGGYALVGMIDSGLAADHPALRQFSATGQYIGGNFIPIASLDVGGWPNTLDGDVDEAEPLPLPPSSPCNPQGLPSVPPASAGHGTHTSGLLAANPDSGFGRQGCLQTLRYSDVEGILPAL
ncbi:MAG: hypothetical protein L0H70_06995 [Xanthomonadales bacterium]|nr:hypothetical protein [Xanthomonadales bacterium]